MGTLPSSPTHLAWTAVALLTLSNAVNYMDRMLVVVLAAPIKQEFALSDTQISLLTGIAFMIVYALSGVFLAQLADRVSRKGVITATLALWSLLTLASGTAQSFLQALLARAGLAFGQAGCIPPSYSIISSHFEAKHRSMPMAIFSAGSTIGILICFVLGSAICERWGWRITFIAASVPGLLLAAALLLPLRKPSRVPPVAGTGTTVGFRETVRVLAGNRVYVRLVAGQSLASFASIGALQSLPLFMMRSHGITLGEVGLLFGPAIALGMTFGLLLGGWAGQRIAPRSRAAPLLVSVWTAALVVPAYWLALWVPDRNAAVVTIFAATTIALMSTPPYIAVVQDVCDARVRATAAAVSAMFASLMAGGLMPLLVGMLSDGLHAQHGSGALRIALTVVVGLMLPGAWLFERARRRLEREGVLTAT